MQCELMAPFIGKSLFFEENYSAVSATCNVNGKRYETIAKPGHSNASTEHMSQ